MNRRNHGSDLTVDIWIEKIALDDFYTTSPAAGTVQAHVMGTSASGTAGMNRLGIFEYCHLERSIFLMWKRLSISSKDYDITTRSLPPQVMSKAVVQCPIRQWLFDRILREKHAIRFKITI